MSTAKAAVIVCFSTLLDVVSIGIAKISHVLSNFGCFIQVCPAEV